MVKHVIRGPYFEEFYNGQIFGAPAITVTSGLAAHYQAIIGDRLRLPLSKHLCQKTTGDERGLVHPMLTINIVNGQTTFASQNVKGNLFYRGLILKRPVFVGDTLTTKTKVVALRQNRLKPGRDATGMVALEIETKNQDKEVVLKYWRCPMIACEDPNIETGHHDSFDWIPERLTDEELLNSLPEWEINALSDEKINLPAQEYLEGDEISLIPQDSVTSAPELVRITGNIAYAHTDSTKSYLGKRLVYGGHTISLAFAQILRAFPDSVTLVAWQKCDHLAPVLEEDIVSSEIKIIRKIPTDKGGFLYELHVISKAAREHQGKVSQQDVLEWELVLWSL